MDLCQVSEHLNLLPKLNRKQVFDTLFNLGHTYKEFKELLVITHSNSNRKKLLRYRELRLVRLQESTTGSFKLRVSKLLEKTPVLLSSLEYHILFTLVENPHITPSVRDSLKDSLGYVLEEQPMETLRSCAVCSITCPKEICVSCKRNILSFLVHRRESFIIPINYINFNIRGAINTDGELHFVDKDWDIFKCKTTIKCTLLDRLQDGSAPIQYELPFVELQRPLS